MKAGYIYVMEDQVNCNLIKIGHSNDPVERLRQLYTTGTPLPNRISYLWGVEDMLQAEKVAHSVMSAHRLNPGREFFYIVPPQSNLTGSDCPDTCSVYLEALVEQIEDGFSFMDIKYDSIDLDWFRKKYAERLKLFPGGVKGF